MLDVAAIDSEVPDDTDYETCLWCGGPSYWGSDSLGACDSDECFTEWASLAVAREELVREWQRRRYVRENPS